MPQPTAAHICCVLLSLAATTHAAGQSVLSSSSSSSYVCTHPPYQVHRVSSSPFVLYLEGFLTPEECAHVQAVTCVSAAYP